MRYLLTFLLAFVMSAFAADVKPFVFGNVSTDSAAQQNEFDYLLKYKLFGRDYLQMGRRVIIPDKSGWNGSANNITSAEQISLGGTTLAGGYIALGDACQLTTGPIRAQSLTAGNDNNGHMFGGTVCLANTSVSSAVQTGINRAGGHLTSTCPELPEPPVNLSIPTISWPSTGYQQDILIDANYGTAYIDVPDGTDTYDVYFDKIHLNRETENGSGKEGAKLYIRMQDGGRLTRIFVHDLQIGNHTSINVIYRTDEGDVIQSQKQYRGNVMFYSDNNITFVNTDNVPIQGTFMTDKKISLKCNLDFAGQLLANELYIGDDFKGENFKFVPFDPDTLDIDPELNKDGGLRENDSTVTIPIRLSDTATVDVYFNYCFDLRDGVTTDDFNLVTDFPICGQSTKTVMIPTGKKVPTDTIKVNVKKDTITEPNDYLVMKISIESGAVLPNNKTDGELKIKIIDADVSKKLGFDTTAVYSEYENYTGDVTTIKVVNASSNAVFSLDSAYEGRYAIDPVTGMITLVTPVDYETTPIDTIKVTVTDTANTSITGYIPVTVNDVNEAPKITTATIAISENLPVPTKVGIVEWADDDIRAVFRDNVVEGIAVPDGVTISPDGSVYTTKVFDFEKDAAELEMTVKVYDKNDPTLYDIATIKLTIADIDESPVVSDTSFTIPENSVGEVGTLVASDPEGKGLTYKIVEENSGFTVDENGTITNTTPFDYESGKVKVIHVEVSDGAVSSVAEVTINIANVNEPVHAKDTTLTVPEDYTGPIGKVTGTDDDGTTPDFSVSDTARYSIDSTGTITLKEPFDYETTKADTVIVFVTDGTFTDTAKVVVNVQNVNENPILQPNDSLTVPENCTGCTVGVVVATDGDGDTLTYTIDDPRFDIDSTGKITTKEQVDYEKEKEITVKVTVSDPSGAKDSLDYVIKVVNVNEPVHVNDTTCSVRENYTGEVCTIPARDDDGTPPTYILTDTTDYSIDSTGKLVIKNPIDYEEKTADTVTVIVTDGTFYDTAKVVIRVMDEPEKTEITEVDDEPKPDTLKTNDPYHKIDWKICEGGKCEADSMEVKVHGDTTIKVCNAKKTSCDQVVILFNDVPPVVTLTNAKSTTAAIDYITIEEQKDEKIYVNKKDNPITVTVRDTVRNTEKKFDIEVKLDTLPSKKVHVEDYGYTLDEFAAVVTPIGDGLAEMEQVVITDGVKVHIKQVVDAKTKEPVEKYQTVSYTTKVDGKDVVVSYKVDPKDASRKGDFTVSYMLDSCTSVSYAMDEKKNIVKNAEGNIGYTIGYEYVDDFGNKASASVEIVYDDIPPVVEILSPAHGEVFKTNAVAVKWTVNGEVQDTLTLQRLEKGANTITRRYVDKAGNEAVATVYVIMKEAKDIDIRIIHPVTEIDQDKVDAYYADGHKYDKKNPYEVKLVDPKADSIPETIGIGFLVDIALPIVSATGGMATLDDIVVNGQIPVDDNGKIVGASTKGIPVEQYVEEHCTEEFQNDYRQNGLNIPMYDIKYQLHLWVWTTTAGYVNDFKVEYTLNDEAMATEAGTVQMVIDWLADKEGSVNASNGKQLGTSSYITTLYSKSVAKHRCDYKEQKKGEKTVKKEDTTKIFGYKRPEK